MGVIRRIAFAVRNLDAAKGLFESLFGAEFLPSGRVTGEDVRAVEAKPGPSEPILELVEPVDDDSAVARFIRKRGEGVHHLSVAVPDLEAAGRAAEAQGARVIRTTSYYRRADGTPLVEAFLHPKDGHGVLVHLVEES